MDKARGNWEKEKRVKGWGERGRRQEKVHARGIRA